MQKTSIDPARIPRHIAIIMDGNGRWAQKQGLPRVKGHQAGVKSVREIVRVAGNLGVEVLTLYAFSTENWNRPALEVRALMTLLKTYLKDELENLQQNNVSLRCIGQTDKLPREVRTLAAEATAKTAANSGLILNLALNYGGRAEIVEAAKRVARKCVAGELDIDSITEDTFAAHLFTGGLPDPDLLIRTGGESRLSNFLLWQSSYAEIYVTDIYWPEFREESLLQAISNFQDRQRRFGKTGCQVEEGRGKR
jgi:undecaprenyl diphosphate synthase